MSELTFCRCQCGTKHPHYAACPTCSVPGAAREPLSAEYLAQCERDARRFQGAYIGTSGTLAAHIIRLLKERERLVVLIAMLEERHGQPCPSCHSA